MQITKILLQLVFASLALSSARVSGTRTRVHDEAASVKRRPPVLLIPGDGGNQIEYKLDRKDHIPHWFCRKSSHGWKRLWLDVLDLLPGEIDCWNENIKLHFNVSSGKFSNAPGVEIRVPGFGTTTSVEYVDPWIKSEAGYMNRLVAVLVAHGYTREKDLAAAPYDFRLAVISHPNFVSRTIRLVEDLYFRNNNTKVALVSHSMGSIVTLFILQNRPQAWKDKFIHSWTSFSGIFAGTVLEYKVLASGDNFNVPIVSSSSVVTEQRSYESNYWMLPTEQHWSTNPVLMKTPFRNYTVRDIDSFLRDVGYAQGINLRKRTSGITNLTIPPQVPVNLYIGRGLPTPLQYIYTKGDNKTWFKNQPTKILTGDGDSIVNSLSLEAPLSYWPQHQSNHVSVRYFENVTHSGILTHTDALQTFVHQLLHGFDESALV
eukprot:CAMPEP_0171516056 /NCGR_PEP_ID=MMETSP0959-20130129/3813_1 /TAXON_ID=87120 /ORGANISM="Aurantiochytrium limacinum, Strain ATCCMYA-1381" /LENGTH=430 /DNA_ID=CAMNT_0012054701 /DNA_START=167 /DNA_END=1459 /DNA_ORIENTATION=-